MFRFKKLSHFNLPALRPTPYANRGQTLVELLLALGIFALIMTAVLALVLTGLTTNLRSQESDRATLLAQEGLDAARSIRDRDWDAFAIAGTHGVSTALGRWEWNGASDATVDGRTYTRDISIANVNRDAQNNIVSSGGTNDPHTKKITSRVQWSNGVANPDVTLVEYLTDWAYQDFLTDTQADFSTAGGSSSGLTLDANGTVYLSGPISGSQTYTRAPINTGSFSQFMKAEWDVDALPAGTTLTLRVRSAPDSSGVPGAWVGWSSYAMSAAGAGSAVLSTVANNQWVQFEVVFDPVGTGTTPVLDWVSIRSKTLY